MGLVNVDLQWKVFLGEHMLLLLQGKALQVAVMGPWGVKFTKHQKLP